MRVVSSSRPAPTTGSRPDSSNRLDRIWSFAIDAMQRRSLLEGQGDLDLALRDVDEIRAWEERDRERRPWAWSTVRRK
jgi:hypothetical protein